MKRLIVLMSILLFTSSLTIVSVTAQESGSILQAIQDRGELLCGVNEGLAGFGEQQGDAWSGFDVDICRAVAAAILGDADAVTFVTVSAADRPIVLATGDVDMLARNTTLTLSRDTEWRANFGPITFYDGQGIMVHRESGIISLELLVGGTICVETATTSELNIREVLDGLSYPYRLLNPAGDEIFTSEATDLPLTTIRTFTSADEMLDTFLDNRCDAVTTDQSGLAARRAQTEDPSALTILPDTLSKEPLAPLSPDSDPEFANVIQWTVLAMIRAEEAGINSENVASLSDNAQFTPFLGTGSESVGDNLGIPNDFVFAIISQVGNYGEIYERHLGVDTPLGLPRGLNNLWTEGGLLYSPPFR